MVMSNQVLTTEHKRVQDFPEKWTREKGKRSVDSLTTKSPREGKSWVA